MESATLIKFILGLSVLAYASLLDWKTRLIPNRVWIIFLALTLPFTMFEIFLIPHSKVEFIIGLFQALFVVVISMLFYYLGLYGGADAKALMAIAISFPFYPQLLGFPLLLKGFSFAFSTLSNAVIFAPLFTAYFFIRNIVKEGIRDLRKYPLYYFIGKKVGAGEIPRHHSLLQYVDENGRVVNLKRGVEPDEKMIRLLYRAKKEGRLEMVWVTPQIPFIIFITIGYIMSLFFGDVLSYIILGII